MALILAAVVHLHPLRRLRGADGRGGGARDEVAARQRAQHLRRARGRLHADPDRDHRRLLVQRPGGPFNFTWSGFTLDHWKDAFAIQELTDALITSLELAAVATLIATVLGTLIAMALVRYQFFGRRAANLLIVIPIATPEVVIGAALLSMFVCRRS